MNNEPIHELKFSDQSCQTDEDYAWMSKNLNQNHFIFKLFNFLVFIL